MWAPLVYRYGAVKPKMLAMFLFNSGILVLGMTTSDAPSVIVPGIICVGLGGYGLFISNIKVSTFISTGAAVYVALINGAVDSSGITFRFFKLFHDNGLSSAYSTITIIALNIILSGTSVIFHKYWPHSDLQNDLSVEEKINGLEEKQEPVENTDVGVSDILLSEPVKNTDVDVSDLSLSKPVKNTDVGVSDISLSEPVKNTDVDVSDLSLSKPVKNTDVGVSDLSLSKPVKNTDVDVSDIPLRKPVKNTDMDVSDIPLRDSLCCHLFFTLSIWFCILFLVYILYIGIINKRLEDNFPDDVSYYTNMLTYINLGGFITAFLPGFTNEWLIYIFQDAKDQKEKYLMPLVLPLCITSILAALVSSLTFLTSVISLYAEFVVLTVQKSYMFVSLMQFVVKAFPVRHGTFIYSVVTGIAGVFTLMQYGLFRWYNSYTGAPAQVKTLMTILSVVSLIHPIAVFLTAKGIIPWNTFYRRSQPIKNETVTD